MPMFQPTALPGVIEIIAERHRDERGFFSEVYHHAVWAQNNVRGAFVQDNHSFSRAKGVLRGLHFQTPPAAQAKLVRVSRGAIFDVAVDIRVGSPTFGKWVGVELSAEKWNQLYIPAGFAHGFVTLVPDTECLYKVSTAYSPAHDRSIRFDDPAIGIKWPVDAGAISLSPKDLNAGLLAETETGFVFEE